MRKILGLMVALATAMSLIGVAWASDDTESEVSADAETESSLGSSVTFGNDSTPTTMDDDLVTPTTLDDDDDTTSTTIDDDDDDPHDSTTSTTVDDDRDTTSTTIDDDDDDPHDGTTSTTVDDDDDDTSTATVVGVRTYSIVGVGTVTIDVAASSLVLVSADAPGWEIEIDKVEPDRIEIEFTRGESEAEFDAELQSNGALRVEIETD